MRPRLDPWPAVSDLFAGLLVACFAGLVLISARHQEIVKPDLRKVQDCLLEQAEQQLKKLAENVQTVDCGLEKCLSVDLHYAPDEFEIPSAFVPRINRASQELKHVLDSWGSEQSRHIEIVIEGHTDPTIPPKLTNSRERLLYNWQLSAKRAAYVLNAFQENGLTAERYRIVAAGFADSNPICTPADNRKCFPVNRRTQFRLRADTQAIENWLKKVGQQKAVAIACRVATNIKTSISSANR
ncbi:MAG TPA: OmpA family protein [Nitrososphaera sp.]|nr:OmpA family protein [Nitrososphaera sp.]